MKRIRICNFGRIMLKLFCVTTILLSVYLLFGFFGYYQKWFDGPAGITQQTMYWLIRLGIAILVEALIFWIGIITVYLKLVDCLEKCLIYGHIRRVAD